MAYTTPDEGVTSTQAKLAIEGINILDVKPVLEDGSWSSEFVIFEYYWDDPDVPGKVRWSKGDFHRTSGNPFNQGPSWEDELIAKVEDARKQLRDFYGRQR